jgi:hypothetical protein
MADQCGHAPACPLNTRKPTDPMQLVNPYRPTVVISGVNSFMCINFEEGTDEDHGSLRTG